MLRGCCYPPISIKMIIEGIKGQKYNALVWEVSYVRRTFNMAAHLLARNAQLLVKVLFGLRISHPLLNFKFQKMYLVWTLVQFNEIC